MINTGRLKEIRQSQNITQEEISEHIGVARQTFILIEKGEGDPRMSTMGKIAEYLQVPISVLLIDCPESYHSAMMVDISRKIDKIIKVVA